MTSCPWAQHLIPNRSSGAARWPVVRLWLHRAAPRWVAAWMWHKGTPQKGLWRDEKDDVSLHFRWRGNGNGGSLITDSESLPQHEVSFQLDREERGCPALIVLSWFWSFPGYAINTRKSPEQHRTSLQTSLHVYLSELKLRHLLNLWKMNLCGLLWSQHD